MMRSGQIRSSLASILAFGRVGGLGHRNRQHTLPAIAKPVTIDEPTMTADDMGITFQSNPELYRAINPIFGGRKDEPASDRLEQL
jgi:hypothetical protein